MRAAAGETELRLRCVLPRRDATGLRRYDDATTTRFAIEGRGRAVEGGISTARDLDGALRRARDAGDGDRAIGARGD